MLANNQQIDLSLLKKIRINMDVQAKETLIEKYMPMVKHIVRHQTPHNIDYEDLMQEGLIGLLKAIEEFDMERYSVKFSTFAYICILRKIFNVLKYVQSNKQKALNNAFSLYSNINNSERFFIEAMEVMENDPLAVMENTWITQRIEEIIRVYLSEMEYEVMRRILNGYSSGDIQRELRLSAKRVDNARTRARLKLKKVLLRYGSLSNPAIPLQVKKRTDLALLINT